MDACIASVCPHVAVSVFTHEGYFGRLVAVAHTVLSCCLGRYFLRNAAETQASEVELFLNSVPILNPLSQEEKLQLVDAFEEQTFKPKDKVRNSPTWPCCKA